MEAEMWNAINTGNLQALTGFMTPQTRAEVEKDIARCVICGFEGEYGVEVIETDTVDSLGHDTTKPMCRKVKDCLDRHEASLIRK
jgi:hypothetical protein